MLIKIVSLLLSVTVIVMSLFHIHELYHEYKRLSKRVKYWNKRHR